MEYEPILNKLDELDLEKAQYDLEYDERIKAIGKYISAIAMNELSYELASKKPLNIPVDLQGISEDIDELRNKLPNQIEDAIKTKKQSLYLQHEQNVLRSDLINE